MATYTPLQYTLIQFIYAWIMKRPMGSVTKDMKVDDCETVIRHLKTIVPLLARFVGTTTDPPVTYFWYSEVLPALKERIRKGDE